jgi:hypothetical protein
MERIYHRRRHRADRLTAAGRKPTNSTPRSDPDRVSGRATHFARIGNDPKRAKNIIGIVGAFLGNAPQQFSHVADKTSHALESG